MLYLKDGYVFYQRLQNPDQPEPWKKYYQSGLNEFNSIDVYTENITFTYIKFSEICRTFIIIV